MNDRVPVIILHVKYYSYSTSPEPGSVRQIYFIFNNYFPLMNKVCWIRVHAEQYFQCAGANFSYSEALAKRLHSIETLKNNNNDFAVSIKC